MTRTSTTTSLALSLAFALLPACEADRGDAAESVGSSATGDALESSVERGPVRVTLAFSPAAPRLSDEPSLSIAAAAEDGVDVRLPTFTDSIGGFTVLGFEEPPTRIEDGRAVVRQVYRLEPTEAGPHVIEPFEIAFVDRDGGEHSFSTDRLEVEVRSLLGEEAPSLDALRPPAGPATLEVETTRSWGTPVALAGALVAIMILLLALRRRGRRVEPERVLTPSERAEQELHSLVEDDPLARDELQTFFVELTAIVRRYIERTTGVRAPEQTTAEFLREMRSHEGFVQEARQRLRDFLEAADLVKFAGVRPAPDDIEESFRRAQEFVGLEGSLALASGEKRDDPRDEVPA